ncbi:MAG: ribonuclease P protein component [Clostridiales bacterium]|nr:ribonuclease P protein component [Clostridiales bacterium]
MTMKSSQPLRYNYEFSRVYKRGKRMSGKHVVIHFFKRPRGLRHNLTPIAPDMNRVGFSGNRRIKGAVKRNRARRLLRESYRSIEKDLPLGFDFIIMMKYADPLPTFAEVDEEMRQLFGRWTKAGDKGR